MTEGEFDVMFRRLLIEQPTEKLKVTLLQLQKEFGLRDDDALWPILVVLGHYERLYERIPEKIAAASSYAIEQVKRGIQSESETFKRRLEREMTDAILKQVETVAVGRARAARRWSMAIASTILLLTTIVIGAAGYWWGRSRGEQIGNLASAWAILPNGEYARKLDTNGVLADLRKCRNSKGDFSIPSAGGVVCTTSNGLVHSRGLRPRDLAPDDDL